MDKYRMKVYNADKTEELMTYDRSKGRLHNDILEHEDGTTEYILVFTPFTDSEIEKRNKIQQIGRLKGDLSRTDYQAIKFAEGELTAEEFAETKEQRKAWRAEINQLQEEIAEIQTIIDTESEVEE